ncbi:MAG: hypothetical protein ACFFDX_12735 [Candidatus Odinarchaeota archaeon]
MVSFDQVINKGHKRLAYNRNLGKIEINDDKLILFHEEFVKEISYDEIESIVKKKAIIKITLKNGELIELLDSLCLKPTRSFQDSRNILRMANIAYNFLNEKWENKK